MHFHLCRFERLCMGRHRLEPLGALDRIHRVRLAEILRRDFEEVANGEEFLRLLQNVPEVWHRKPEHFHVWLARKNAELTQRQLGALAGVHQSFVSRVENGRDVRLSSLRRLYAALGYRMLVLPLKRPPTEPMPSRAFSPSPGK
jgi:hypothetical protein